jgi:hypothetical protein
MLFLHKILAVVPASIMYTKKTKSSKLENKTSVDKPKQDAMPLLGQHALNVAGVSETILYQAALISHICLLQVNFLPSTTT